MLVDEGCFFAWQAEAAEISLVLFCLNAALSRREARSAKLPKGAEFVDHSYMLEVSYCILIEMRETES